MWEAAISNDSGLFKKWDGYFNWQGLGRGLSHMPLLKMSAGVPKQEALSGPDIFRGRRPA
jgi:hypothetical protein